MLDLLSKKVCWGFFLIYVFIYLLGGKIMNFILMGLLGVGKGI